jgi:hypothetical protein
MSGLRKSDHPERRKIALMRRADTEAGATHNIGGVKKRDQRNKPSLPKMPWDEASAPSPSDRESQDNSTPRNP